MSLERAVAWLNRHYTWPVVIGLVLIMVLAPVSRPVIGVLMLAAAVLATADGIRRISRAFREGYRGTD
ncbi:MAG: hypothetical protein NTV23_17495 [Propionibacteriales bacterium]|nr:hypothetical protein [Propionibacteriales bacterium]